MDIHKLLKRQLDRCKLNAEVKPQNNKLWQAFISRVNQTYMDNDQDRYMSGRSMEISSREMTILNQRLEHAHHIAMLGYWSYDGINDRIIWSKELYFLLNLDLATGPQSLDKFMELVYESDRYGLEKKVKNALQNKVDYEYEFRIKNSDGLYRWYKTVGQCMSEEKQLSGILLDIHKNKTAEEKIKELNQKVLLSAHRAGMAEVATTVLHNIGNILNSSNTSINLLKNSRNQNSEKKLFKILGMLVQHELDLSDFIINDPKGKIIPEYLLELSKKLIEESQKNSTEIDNLMNDLEHITQIVAMQNPISGNSNLPETIYIPDVIETALTISISLSEFKLIEVVKEFSTCPLIVADRSKLLQILINLIQNAKDAVLLNTRNPAKELKINIRKINPDSLQIDITDNGIGIDPNNLNRIFSFGFTTKKTGHGFGLHSSALSAQSMGGSLLGKSAGIGCGAQFIFTLPIEYETFHAGACNG